jgi:CubicO group peptidase (beta-lactamase class C family)
MDEAKLREARDYALTGGGSGMISRGGYLVYSWGNQGTRYDLKSSTKSIGGSALGLAIGDGFVSLTDHAQQYLPTIAVPPTSNAATGWPDDITVLQLATHTAGFDKPGGYASLLFQPGTTWSYSDAGANWLADLLTVTYNEDLKTLLFERLFSHLGIESADLSWRLHQYREQTLSGVTRRELGSGISANVDAMGRIGYLYLRNGNRSAHPGAKSLVFRLTWK